MLPGLILNLQVDSELKVLNGNREERLLLSNIVDPVILSQAFRPEN